MIFIIVKARIEAQMPVAFVCIKYCILLQLSYGMNLH